MSARGDRLVELGRKVDTCVRHGGDWCSCKVRQFIALMDEDEPGANPSDPEDCDACSELDDWCAFHKGHAHGWALHAEFVRLALDDPESLWPLVMAKRARDRATEDGQ